MKDKIMVIGGYGAVGQIICSELVKEYPYKVYAAGRKMQKAEDFSSRMEGKVKPMVLDIKEPFSREQFMDVKLVVMCLDQTNTDFLENVLESGIDYMDITASFDFITQVEKLKERLQTEDSTALFSVGLTPGLSNLMAKEAMKSFEQTKTIDIAIMLSLGDQHGNAAIQWTLDHMNKDFWWLNDGKQERAESFLDGKTFSFGKELGNKRAYRFPFSDQLTIAETLSVPVVKTRLCFDSNLVTNGLAVMKKMGLLRLLKNQRIYHIVEKLMKKIPWGSDRYALKVEAKGVRAGRKAKTELLLMGRKEGEITGLIAALTAKKLYEGSFANGIYHIEQVFTLSMFTANIKEKIMIRHTDLD